MRKLASAIPAVIMLGFGSILGSGCGSAVDAAAAPATPPAGTPATAEAASATQPGSGWRCTAEDPADGSGWIIQKSKDNTGWTALINDCSIGSGTPQAPCGGIQARVDPVEENGWINFYQHGFPRILVTVATQPRPDGTYEGRRPALGVTYSCTRQ